MHFEYVAVSWRTANAANDDEFVREKASLLAKGWIIERCAPWSRENMPRRLTGGACIMRRPKDEPRMWTEGEIYEIATRSVLHVTEVVKSLIEDARTEADMQTTYRKELQRRNEELQAAIDEVVNRGRELGLRGDNCVSYAVRQHLYPLATKKEKTNG